jgi:hypothetical protein
MLMSVANRLKVSARNLSETMKGRLSRDALLQRFRGAKPNPDSTDQKKGRK